ncbi:MAG TPA: CYTH and CHAD domain-containing protein [Pseudonocardiaceae bacterium]|nr:CYTH and CHAD domain-containing protein [Pseudonocardiaceae bacterium]
MTALITELERKYEADGCVAEPALNVVDQLPGLNVDPTVLRDRLWAVYYDTQDLALINVGILLCRRAEGTDSGWYLTLPGRGTRTELRLPTDPPDGVLPAKLGSLVAVATRHAPLTPVARTDTDRVSRYCTDMTGSRVVEIIVDRVVAADLRPAGRTRRWTEVEVGVEDGTRPADLLDRIEVGLSTLGLHHLNSADQLARTLGLTQCGHSSVTPSTDSTAGEVVMSYVTTQVAAVKRGDIGVRLEQPGAVHHARTAVRRLRSTLKVFRSVLEATKTASLAENLAWLDTQLSAGPDTEAQRTRFARGTSRQLTEPAADLLADYFDGQENAAVAGVAAALDSERYGNLLTALDDLVATPPLTTFANRPADEVLPRLVRHAFTIVQEALAAIGDDHSAAERNTAVHEAQWAAQRAWYAAELIEPLRPEPVQRCAAAAARLQDLIGEYQNSVTARETLTMLADEADAVGTSAFGYGRLYQHEVAQANRIADSLPHQWQQAERLAEPLFRHRY